MKRVLCLVLSTDKEFYGRLAEASRATWDAEDIHGVETIFYFGRSDKPTTDKYLNTGVDDDYWNMGRKTLAAFEYALKHREFDYVFRANASLYVHKPGLRSYVQDQLQFTNLALGVVADCGKCGDETFPFLWGPSYLLSRDVVEKVVANGDLWKHDLTDDLSISYLLRQIGIPLDNRGSMASIALKNGGGYYFVYYEAGASGGAYMDSLSQLRDRLPNQWCFRVKDDADRNNDTRLMKELKEVFK